MSPAKVYSVRKFYLAGLLGLTGLLLVGCSRPVSQALPAAAPDAVRSVAEGLAENRPQVLWDALPPSYQADIRGLIATFCDHADREVYQRTFRVLDKGVQVLQRKKEFLFNSPLTLNNGFIDSGIGLHWQQAVGVLEALVHSELASLDSLRRMDPGAFLASTGAQVMQGLEELVTATQRVPDRNPWVKAREALAQAQIRFVAAEGNRGFLSFASTNTADGREVELTQVEGRWVPATMAATWKAKVAEAQAGLARLDSAEAQKARPMVLMVLGTLEGGVDSLLAAKSQKEFDEALRQWKAIGDLAKAAWPQPGGTQPPATPEVRP